MHFNCSKLVAIGYSSHAINNMTSDLQFTITKTNNNIKGDNQLSPHE